MDPFIGEIRMFAGNYAPESWAFCNGANISIQQYEAVYALIGTTYGGDGISTFGLPDLRGRAPMHRKTPGYPMAQKAGTESVTLTGANVPPHSHSWQAMNTAATTNLPGNNMLASVASGSFLYEPTATINQLVPINPNTVSPFPSAATPLNNMQPFLALSFIFALSGFYPTQQ